MMNIGEIFISGLVANKSFTDEDLRNSTIEFDLHLFSV
jgi:hypothetical protein